MADSPVVANADKGRPDEVGLGLKGRGTLERLQHAAVGSHGVMGDLHAAGQLRGCSA